MEREQNHLEGLACACATINFISNACNNAFHAFNGLHFVHGWTRILSHFNEGVFFIKKNAVFGVAFSVRACVCELSEAESHPDYNKCILQAIFNAIMF